MAAGVVAMFGLLVWAMLAAFKPSRACYALSDREALSNVLRDDNAEPASAKSGPGAARMKLSWERLVGVGPNEQPRESGDYLTQLWFVQDDKSLTVANDFEDCELKFSPGASFDEMKNAAYRVYPPKF